ncbi:hypothetical protein JDV02_004426 [Purpureocillium takamizusanense]|uniref:GH18 domain-containing protein n=1 Tax=Purpureocillium takamizusanense TaxID=2060973 RepID=A0A9Q8VAU2_9HYPO|nr:uncharacterized protein JDV02_004426 [Purpureocillium takamizusanense]UNI18137.1 hypothetical protein JDV02_004426 [Purpureocillium takamizusanense]
MSLAAPSTEPLSRAKPRSSEYQIRKTRQLTDDAVVPNVPPRAVREAIRSLRYPGAPVPPGDKADGSNYLALLTEVRKLLPAGKTLSISAPASFWYLKGFPIDRMEPLLDYIVYLMYDLHGQWDSGNLHSAPGCPAGNCLRSHVNWTETENALAMITKACVPTSKILLGRERLHGPNVYLPRRERFPRQEGAAASDFMFDHGKEYFKCNIREVVTCCTGCKSIPDYSCTQCLPPGECKITSPYDDALRLIHSTIEECPPDYSKAGMGPAKYRDIQWTLKEGKEDDFWAEIQAEVGIPKKKMPLSETGQYIYGFVTNSGCYYSRRDDANATLGDAHDDDGDGDEVMSGDRLVGRNVKKNCMGKGYWTGAPNVDGRVSEDDVTNPKDTVKKALDKSSGLVSDLASLALEVKSGMYKGDAADLVDAVAMPIYMIREGLDYMDTVVDMAKEIKEAEKKTLIVSLLSAVLFVVPALGEAIGTLGLASLGRALVAIGELGNTSLGIYSVVDNPKAAPIFIFGLVLSAKGVRDSNDVVKAAKARRAMPHQDIVGFSTKIAERLAQVDKVMSKGKGRLCASNMLRTTDGEKGYLQIFNSQGQAFLGNHAEKLQYIPERLAA